MILSFALLSCLLFLFFLPQLFYLCVRRGSLLSAGKLLGSSLGQAKQASSSPTLRASYPVLAPW
jgi:hypothetical protein